MVVGVLTLAIVMPWLAGQLRALPAAAKLGARASERIVTLEVGGMTCGGCAARIHGELAATPGVSAVEVRWQQRRAYVVYGRNLPDSSLTGAVRRAGPGFLAAIVAK
jgi:copper chaperone CopZ